MKNRNYEGLRSYIAVSSGRFNIHDFTRHTSGAHDLLDILKDMLVNDYPLNPLQVFETVINSDFFEELSEQLISFTEQHKSLSSNVNVNTKLILSCLRFNSELALKLLISNDLYDSDVIINHPDLKKSWKCEFVLCDDSTKVKIALELTEKDVLLNDAYSIGRIVVSK